MAAINLLKLIKYRQHELWPGLETAQLEVSLSTQILMRFQEFQTASNLQTFSNIMEILVENLCC